MLAGKDSAMSVNRMPERNILSSWKEIASYVGKGVRTVQRWELTFHLPVRRGGSHGKNVVVAFTDEIDSWVHSRFKQRVYGSTQSELHELREQNAQLVAENKSLRRLLKQKTFPRRFSAT